MLPGEFEAFLEDISLCFQAADFDLWRSRVRVPLCLAYSSGSRTIKSECEARNYFQECLMAMRARHIDTIVRRPLTFDDCDDEVILATYETRLLGGAIRIGDPFETTGMLRRLGGRLVAGSLLDVHDFSVGSRAYLQRSAIQTSAAETLSDYVRQLH